MDKIIRHMEKMVDCNELHFKDFAKLLVIIKDIKEKIPEIEFKANEEKPNLLYFSLPGWRSFIGFTPHNTYYILGGILMGFDCKVESAHIIPSNVRKIKFSQEEPGKLK